MSPVNSVECVECAEYECWRSDRFKFCRPGSCRSHGGVAVEVVEKHSYLALVSTGDLFRRLRVLRSSSGSLLCDDSGELLPLSLSTLVGAELIESECKATGGKKEIFQDEQTFLLASLRARLSKLFLNNSMILFSYGAKPVTSLINSLTCFLFFVRICRKPSHQLYIHRKSQNPVWRSRMKNEEAREGEARSMLWR
jgi:hypothetical protein